MRRLRLLLVLATLSAASAEAFGKEPGRDAGPSPALPSLGAADAAYPVFAGFLSGLAGRGRAIQVAIVLMCAALFILMKKFADTGPCDLSPKPEANLKSPRGESPTGRARG